MTIDDIRAAHPHLGLALYAYEPGGLVTLEVHTPEGDIFSFQAHDASAVLAQAFHEEQAEEEDSVFG